MAGQNEVRIPFKRLRLIGIFCASALYLLLVYLMLGGFIKAIGQNQFSVQTFVLILVVIAIIVSIPYIALFAIWAFARLIFNSPALILTPVGIMNHSIVYHVVVPWSEIEGFICAVPKPSRYRRGMTGNFIIVDEKDEQHLYALQQPVTKALLRLFKILRPVNISTAVTAGTQAAVWAQLQRYVHETLPNNHIKFTTI